MAKTLLALPKSQIATMEELSAEVKALVAEGKRLKGNHGAAKRHEGALAGALRRMTESEMDALVVARDGDRDRHDGGDRF